MSCYFLESTAFAKLFVQEPGTDALIRLMETVEDNRKLIAASTPLEVYAAIRRRERAGDISPEDAASALEILRLEAARMVQEPLNPAVLEAARQLSIAPTCAGPTPCNWAPRSSPATCFRARRSSLSRLRSACWKLRKPRDSTSWTRCRNRCSGQSSKRGLRAEPIHSSFVPFHPQAVCLRLPANRVRPGCLARLFGQVVLGIACAQLRLQFSFGEP